MTALVDRFALIGRSFPSDGFEALQRAAMVMRAERRSRRGGGAVRTWRGIEDAIIVPKRLSA